MTKPEIKNPIWAWIVLVGGGLFLLRSAPSLLMVMLIPLWRTEEVNFFTIPTIGIALFAVIGVIWGMIRAYKAIIAYNMVKKNPASLVSPHNPAAANEPKGILDNQKPIWPWLVIAPGALLLIGGGPTVFMLPLMPLLLAGFSSDSPSTPD